MSEPSEAQRLCEAMAWQVRLQDAGLEGSATLDAWLAQDPANRVAWRKVRALWRELGEAATTPAMIVARRDALRRAGAAATVRLPDPTRRRMAASVVGGVMVGAAAGLLSLRPAVYATDIGERRILTLSDGSLVSLDSATRLEVRYDRRHRALTLLKGQARFDVAHDAARPFTVAALDRIVVATGTSFTVERLQGQVLVTLLEGSARVVPMAGARAAGGAAVAPAVTVRLRPGDRMLGTGSEASAPPRVEQVDLDKATAWQSGKLVFEDEPLATVVQRVSRYTAKPVVVDSPASALKISGVFTAGDLATFVDTVTAYLPLEATRRADGAIALRGRAG